MRQNSELRKYALTTLEGNWTNAVLITLIYIVILGGVSSLGVSPALAGGSTGLSLLLLPIGYGTFVAFLSLTRGEKLEIGMIFDGFKDYVRIWLTLLLMQLYTAL